MGAGSYYQSRRRAPRCWRGGRERPTEKAASATSNASLAAFSFAYADQTERDHAALERAVRQGTVKASVERAG
jgi:hypothetical protein